MKNDILLKYRMLNAEEVNREIFKDFILDLQAIRILFDIKMSQNVGVKKMASG